MGKYNTELSLTEELDFHYLLTLMRPLHDEPEFSWLPELFTLIGHENVIKLCKYAGGETITIPTLFDLTMSIRAMEYYYSVYISKTKVYTDIPVELRPMVTKIRTYYKDHV